MTVVYILNSTYPFGGSFKSFMSMLEGLMEHEVNPIVVVPDEDGIYKVLQEKNIKTVVTCFRPNTYPHRSTLKDLIWFIPKLIARRIVNRRAVSYLVKTLQNKQIDLVHTNVSVIDIGLRLARKIGVSHVFHIREYGDLDFHEIYYPTFSAFHLILKEKSYSICITKHIQEHHGLVNNPKSIVVYNGIDVPTIDVTSLSKEGYFLFAGRIDASKGLHVLLKAYADYILHSSVKRQLLIAGDLDKIAYYDHLQQIIKEHNLSSQVKFLGGRKDIYQLMQRAAAIVIPSRFEGFGRCMAEAMMNGCLVIGHNTAGLKEQFDNGLDFSGREIGLRYMTVPELSMRLLQVDKMTNEEMQQYTMNAYATAHALYPSSVNVERIYQFYNQIIKQK